MMFWSCISIWLLASTPGKVLHQRLAPSPHSLKPSHTPTGRQVNKCLNGCVKPMLGFGSIPLNTTEATRKYTALNRLAFLNTTMEFPTCRFQFWVILKMWMSNLFLHVPPSKCSVKRVLFDQSPWHPWGPPGAPLGPPWHRGSMILAAGRIPSGWDVEPSQLMLESQTSGPSKPTGTRFDGTGNLGSSFYKFYWP